VRRAETIDTLANLAGGIAHDFNNLLTAIIGHTELLEQSVGPDDPRANDIAGIHYAADLAASLTRQLLAFGRQQVLQPAALDLNLVIERTRRVLARVITEPIVIVVDPMRPLRLVVADRGQIEQMLLNLALNGRDAMPEGGRLVLRTRNVDVDTREARRVGIEPGCYVELSVADTGTGIDESIRPHLFEPFFTTKDRGRGTGLGLATVYGIVKQSGGHITVDTAANQGTTFHIFLPAMADWSARADEAAAREPVGESILVVEHDPAVRGFIEDVLGRRGYELLIADSGRRALELASERPVSVDLLVTDVATPDLSGLAVAEAIRARCPSVRVLYLSGYAEDHMLRGALIGTPSLFLQKPFTPEALVRKVRAVLERS